MPNIPSLIGKDLSCKINITAKFSDFVNLKWIEFGSKLFTSPNSCKNSIEIYDGSMASSSLVSRKCDSNTGTNVRINGSNAVVHYTIKNYQTNKNFRLMYQRGD